MFFLYLGGSSLRSGIRLISFCSAMYRSIRAAALPLHRLSPSFASFEEKRCQRQAEMNPDEAEL